ncbi:unnamed protein product [Timema podura]|uniref:Vitellogenin domain-containing protein n=1 Tax=Timema podura TaxID=61482 RepID=A0ABN7NDE2_TIMPD|nr:unnamed protein product [Timema podura]
MAAHAIRDSQAREAITGRICLVLTANYLVYGRWGFHTDDVTRIQPINLPDLMVGTTAMPSKKERHNMKFHNMTYTKLHTELKDGWWGDIPTSEHAYRTLPITGSSIRALMDRGVIESLSVSHDLNDWEINFIQGVLGHLQLDLTNRNAGETADSNVDHKRGRDRLASVADPVYKVTEDSLMGRCEVLYEISQLPKSYANTNPDWLPLVQTCGSREYLEITKTFNYSNCESSSEYHFGLPSSLNCNPSSNQCGNFWKRTFVNRVIGCGDRHDMLILGSISSSRQIVNLHLHENSEASINSYLNISLASIKTVSRHFALPFKTILIKPLKYHHTSQVLSYSLPMKPPSPSWNSNYPESPESDEKEKNKTPSKPKSKINNKSRRERRSHHSSKYPTVVNIEDSSEENGKANQCLLPSQYLDSSPHRLFTPFSLARKSSQSESFFVQQMKELVNDIVSDLDATQPIPDKMTLEKLTLAVELCRDMNMEDLKKASAYFIEGVSPIKKIHLVESKTMRDIIVMCGTEASFTILKLWIEQKKLEGESAASAIASAPAHFRSPTPELIHMFYEMIRSSAVQEYQQLLISSVLAFSNLLRVACVDDIVKQAQYSVHMIPKPCTKEHASRYISFLEGYKKKSSTLRRVYITALGNTGLPAVLPLIQAIVNDTKASSYLRSSAVFSMKYLAFREPSKLATTLLAIYHSRDYPVVVRISAVSLLFFTCPELSVWQRLAIATWYEPNLALVSFIRSSLETLAQLEDPHYNQMSKNAASALFLSKPLSLGLDHAYNLVRTSSTLKLESVVLEQWSWQRGLDLTTLYYRRTSRLAGLSRLNIETELNIANTDSFLTVLQEVVFPSDDITQTRPPIRDLKKSTKWIYDTLKIAPRLLPHLEGDLHVKLNHLQERILPFDKKLQVDLARAGRKLVEKMKQGLDFHFQKIDQSQFVMSTTTELGFPMTFQISVPWVIQMVGQTNLSQDNMQFGLDISIMGSSQLIADVSFYTEWDNTVHLAASYGVHFMQVPSFQMNARLDKPKSNLFVDLNLKTQEHEYRAACVHDECVDQIRSLSDDGCQPHFPLLDGDVDEVAHVTETRPAWPSATANNNELEITSIPGEFLFLAEDDSQYTNSDDMLTTEYGQQIAPINDSLYNVPETTTDEVGLEKVSNENVSEFTLELSTPMTVQDTDLSAWSRELEIPTEYSAEHDATNETDVYEELFEDIVKYSRNDGTYIGEFNASVVDPFGYLVNENSYKYLLEQVFVGMKSGRAYVVGVNVTVNCSEPLVYSGFWTYAWGPAQLMHKMGFFINSDNPSYRVSFTSSVLKPFFPVMDTSQMIEGNFLTKITADYVYWRNETKYQVSLKGEANRSRKETELLKNNWKMANCSQEPDVNAPSESSKCSDITRAAHFFNFVNLTILYNDQVKNRSSTWMSGLGYLERYMSPYMTDQTRDCREQNAPNRIKVMADIDRESSNIDLWELEINLDNHKVIHVSAGPVIHINKNQLDFEENQVVEVFDLAKTTLVQISISLDRAVVINLPAHEHQLAPKAVFVGYVEVGLEKQRQS